MTDEELDALTDEEVTALKRALRWDDDSNKGFGPPGQLDPTRLRVVVEGDSWTDFPIGTDITDFLREDGFLVTAFSHRGDTLDNMVYGTQLSGAYAPRPASVDEVLATVAASQPRALVFSGGGNDVVGEELAGYLNHHGSGLPALRSAAWRGMLEHAFPAAFRTLTRRVRDVAPNTTVVVHGYAHPYPTGKGTQLLGIKWAGPWILPALAQKRIPVAERVPLVHGMINDYNEMLRDLAAETEGLVHVDVRCAVSGPEDWRDELHLRNSAYRKVAARIAAAVRDLDEPGLG